MSGDEIEVRLAFRTETEVEYTDDLHSFKAYKGTIDTDSLRDSTIKWLSEELRQKVDFCEADGLRLLGRYLYQKAFTGQIAETFEETYASFEKKVDDGLPTTLRLVITFYPGAEYLTNLPWEFLYYAEGNGDGTFLSGEKHSLILTRMVGEMTTLSNKPVSRKPQVLVAVCTPPGLASGISAENIKRIANATEIVTLPNDSSADTSIRYLKGLQLEGRIELEILPDPTFTALKEAVVRGPDVIHFVGHGDPGVLYMRRSEEEVENDRAERMVAQTKGVHLPAVSEYEKVEVSKFETLFREKPRPRLAFLQACYGAALGEGVKFSTALEIVKVGVLAVVAMQYDIDAVSADQFALAFYTKLMSGATIAASVSEGRRTLAVRGEGSAWSHRDFGTPVVYIPHGEAVVVAAPPLVAPAPPASAEEGLPRLGQKATSTCPRCQHAYLYDACPNCKLKFRCQCPRANPVVCRCPELLEIPENAWCAACGHDVEQPPWTPHAPAPIPGAEGYPSPAPPHLRALPPDQDSFQAVS